MRGTRYIYLGSQFVVLACVLAIVAGDTALAATTAPATTRPASTRPIRRSSGAATRSAATQPTAELAPYVVKLLADETLTPRERRDAAIFHGQWERVDNPTVAEQAAIAIARADWTHPSLSDAAAPALSRAQAAAQRGDLLQAVELLIHDTTLRGALIRARALADLGKRPAAIAALGPCRAAAVDLDGRDAGELTALAEGLIELARLEGRPAQDYQQAMTLLGTAHRERDRFYWPAHLAEAKLLSEKDNAPLAVQAITDTLQLNPRCGDVWYLLGTLSLAQFNFEKAIASIQELHRINPAHPQADLLQARLFLTQRDPSSARPVIDRLLARYPRQREAMALRAAVEALSFNEKGLQAAMEQFEAMSPGHPGAAFEAGVYLGMARLYPAAEEMLRRVVAMRPQWPQPRVELALLLMQSGREDRALPELREACRLDPFHKRAANQLKLAEELRGYAELRTEHFVIRYKPGIDEALARDMPPMLETIYREVTAIYGHKPARPTVIEIMPDEQWFGVRITGLPWIWTIGACTGDIIALTPPRQGARQRGAFDWPRVIRHEFTHTVTLDMTGNRIPHWFTEACAVASEPGRDYNTCQMLAGALYANKLFTLDQINWAFIRPKTPQDRPLAYAQANWMLEYITATYGHKAIVRMLDLYRTSPTGDESIIVSVTNRSASQFMDDFRAWAREQTGLWGLTPRTRNPELIALLKQPKPDPAKVAAMLEKHSDDPDLLFAAAQIAIGSGDLEVARESVLRYAAARPVDPWADRMIVQLATATGRVNEARGELEHLDRLEQATGAWSAQLTSIHRTTGELSEAYDAAQRAIAREPYNSSYREVAAAVGLQRGEPEAALHHLRAMTILEPTQAIHFTRMAALLWRMERKDEAAAAAARALELDPKAPVQAFLPSATRPGR